MHITLRGDFSRMPVVKQPSRSVELSVWPSGDLAARSRVSVAVEEVSEGCLRVRVEAYDTRTDKVSTLLDATVPVPTQKVAPEPVSDDPEGSALAPHRWVEAGMLGCGACGGASAFRYPHFDPSLMVDHVYTPGSRDGMEYIQCLACPRDEPVAPLYHPREQYGERT